MADWDRIQKIGERITEMAGGDVKKAYLLIDMARNNDPGVMERLFPEGIDPEELKLLSNYMYPKAQLPGMSIPSAIGGAAYESLAKPVINALPEGISQLLPEGIAPEEGVSVEYDPLKVGERAMAYMQGVPLVEKYALKGDEEMADKNPWDTPMNPAAEKLKKRTAGWKKKKATEKKGKKPLPKLSDKKADTAEGAAGRQKGWLSRIRSSGMAE